MLQYKQYMFVIWVDYNQGYAAIQAIHVCHLRWLQSGLCCRTSNTCLSSEVTTIRVMLQYKQSMFVFWGDYNQGYAAVQAIHVCHLRWLQSGLCSLQYKQYMFVIWGDYNQGYAAVQAIHVSHLRWLQSGLCCSTSNTCLSSEATTIRVMLQYKQYMFVIWGDYNQGYAAVQAIHVSHLRRLQSGLCCSTSNTCLSSKVTTIRVMLQYKQYMFVIWGDYNQGYAAVQAIHVCLLRWLQSGLCCSTSNTCLSSEATTIRVMLQYKQTCLSSEATTIRVMLQYKQYMFVIWVDYNQGYIAVQAIHVCHLRWLQSGLCCSTSNTCLSSEVTTIRVMLQYKQYMFVIWGDYNQGYAAVQAIHVCHLRWLQSGLCCSTSNTCLSSEVTTIRVMLQYKQYMFVIWGDYNQGYAAVQAIHVCHLRRLQSGLCYDTSNTCLSSKVTKIRVMLQYKQYMFVIWDDYNQGYAAVQAIHVCHLRWLQSGLCCSTSNTCLSSELTTIRVMLQYKQYMFVIWGDYNQGYAAIQAIHVCHLRGLQSGLCCNTSNTCLSSEVTTIRVMLQYKQSMFVFWGDYNQGYAAVQAIHVCHLRWLQSGLCCSTSKHVYHLRRLQSGLCCSTSNTCLSSELTTIRVILQYKQYMFVIWGDYNQGYAAVQAIHVCHLRWLQSGWCCNTSNTCLSSEVTTIRVMLQYKQYMFVIWGDYNQGYAAVQAIHVCHLRWLQSGLCCSTSNTCLSSEVTTIRVMLQYKQYMFVIWHDYNQGYVAVQAIHVCHLRWLQSGLCCSTSNTCLSSEMTTIRIMLQYIQ